MAEALARRSISIGIGRCPMDSCGVNKPYNYYIQGSVEIEPVGVLSCNERTTTLMFKTVEVLLFVGATCSRD
ncbi:hypothetical protein HanPSC8_Chr17g0765031 [Helianthus annuus]|nr:hypothetical protein HanPSC8_Chr17g0765031 [Helianthus annuus]